MTPPSPSDEDATWAARKWAKATPRSTLLYVVEEAAEFSDADRVAAAKERLRELDVLFNDGTDQ